MRLMLARDDGTLTEVEEDIEDFDLDRPFARAAVCESIQRAVREARAEGEEG